MLAVPPGEFATSPHDTLPADMAPARDLGAVGILLDAIEELSSARSAEDIAAVIRSSARRLTGADGVAVVVRDGDRCHYVDEDAIGPLWKGRKFPMSACISGWAMLNRETAVIPDIYVDERIPHDAYRPTFVKSLVVTPVRPADPIAAIGAYWAETRTPTDLEIESLKAIARATATAFENVGLIASLNESLERRDFLIRELDHRVKNTLATVQAIARQGLKDKDDIRRFEADFEGRLAALSRAHELLTRKSWKAAPLHELAASVLAPFAPDAHERVIVTGPDVTLTPEAAVTLAMGLHELAANAVKYGALGNDQGVVRLGWDVRLEGETPMLDLVWEENGGPKVTTPEARGMGHDLVSRAVPRVLGGTGRLIFGKDGVSYRLTAPISNRVALA